MENHGKVCPNCGSELLPNDRFCGDCAFDTQQTAEQNRPEKASTVAEPQIAADQVESLGRKSGGNKGAFVFVISFLATMFLIGGGLYWWLSKGNDAELDLTRAATYLSEPGLRCTFNANYPDGTAGIVERFSGQVVPNEAVRVSEVETGVNQGEPFGFGVHYVERADGSYYIYDGAPYDIMPLLKNQLTVGQTWNYQSEFGQIIWTVLDMGVDMDLGFAVFEDCLMVQEDNEMADFQSITYYAPGRGSVLVIDPSGSTEYYKMTALEKIELAQAADRIIQWSPNYSDIRDDNAQNY